MNWKIAVLVMVLGRHPSHKTAEKYRAGTHDKKRQHNYPKQTEGRRDIISKVILYNQLNETVGKIYPRRAKQLVLNGRAIWLDEGQAVQIVQNIMDIPSEIKKEEISMIDEHACITNGEREEAVHALEEVDVLLMYQAKQNVNDKRNLIGHVAAYLFALPFWGIVFSGIFLNMNHPHPMWRNFTSSLSQIWELTPHLPEEYLWITHNIWNSAEINFVSRNVPGLWYVTVGIMLAWGFWIAVRVVRRVKTPVMQKVWAMLTKKDKPDPIVQEYNRLKSL